MGDRELEVWAERQASVLLAGYPDRWRHVRAVAETASRVGRLLLDGPDQAMLVGAAYLHDIGYARSLTRFGFHALDGAEYLRGQGQERLASLVAHHSGARFEAEERGLAEELTGFELEDGPRMDEWMASVSSWSGATKRTCLVSLLVDRLPPTIRAVKQIEHCCRTSPSS